MYAKLSCYALAERVTVNMQGTGFTIARLKIVPTIKKLISRCLHYDRKMLYSKELYVA